jgi:hypothetical protein
MTTADLLDVQVYQLAVMLLAVGGPTALAPFQETSRFEHMAQELEYAVRHTSSADMASLLRYLASDSGSAVIRRVFALAALAENVVVGTVKEFSGVIRAYAADRVVKHVSERVETASSITVKTVSNGAKSVAALTRELLTNPAEAAPKLLVLVLASVATSGGLDGNGGAPDLDIPLMGIGEHRSPFTHSILIGSLLEAALLLLTRIVLCTHKNLPDHHDPLWEGIASKSVDILRAAGQGASIGIAYHLMVDAVAQPGAYHGMPFDMPMEAHQVIFAGNSAAEAASVRSYPTEETLRATPELMAQHKRYRQISRPISPVLQEFLSPSNIKILSTYGAWLKALAKRDISPTTIAQVQFLMVADGNRLPASSHEKAWVALVDAKRRACWTTTAGTGPMYGV